MEKTTELNNKSLNTQSSTVVPSIHNGEKVVSSTNDIGKTGYSHIKEWNLNNILYHKQKQLTMV